jgi:hypothetical protein
MTDPKPDTRRSLTAEAFDDPQPGDRFNEMYSFWMFVVAVEPSGRVATMEAGAPCSFPSAGKLVIHESHDAYRRAFAYGSIAGYWVSLSDRGNDVDGWFAGWPVVTGPADCARCAARIGASS